jgi:hypothetical protein
MRNRKLTILIVIALAGIGSISTSTSGGRIPTKGPSAKRDARPFAQLKSYPKLPVVREPQQPPRPTLTVDTHPDTPIALSDIHHRLAKLMTGNIEVIPPTRSGSVEWFAGSGLVVRGWHGNIIDSVPIANGRLVTLQIAPVLDHTFAVSTSVIEKYAVYENGTIQFVGALPADATGPRVITAN